MESAEDSEKERIFPFGESDFIVDNFNPEQFLAKYSATCDLENLKSDLSAFLGQCESAIMSIMNKDYQSFISLAMHLDGLKEKMENIRTPLVDNKDRLQQHKEDLIKECEVLSNLLKRYQAMEAKKQSLTQFLRIHTIITQSEAIYNSVRLVKRIDSQFSGKNQMQLEVLDYLLLERVSRNLALVSKLLSAYTISGSLPIAEPFSGLPVSDNLPGPRGDASQEGDRLAAPGLRPQRAGQRCERVESALGCALEN